MEKIKYVKLTELQIREVTFKIEEALHKLENSIINEADSVNDLQEYITAIGVVGYYSEEIKSLLRLIRMGYRSDKTFEGILEALTKD